jgi:hypothetical protein
LGRANAKAAEKFANSVVLNCVSLATPKSVTSSRPITFGTAKVSALAPPVYTVSVDPFGGIFREIVRRDGAAELARCIEKAPRQRALI